MQALAAARGRASPERENLQDRVAVSGPGVQLRAGKQRKCKCCLTEWLGVGDGTYVHQKAALDPQEAPRRESRFEMFDGFARDIFEGADVILDVVSRRFNVLDPAGVERIADLREGIESVFAEWRTALGEKIGRTPGGMRLDSKRRAAAANFIISVYSGAMNLAKATQSANPLSDAARLLSDWLRAQQLAS